MEMVPLCCPETPVISY